MILIVPPLIVIEPSLSVSVESGSDLIPSLLEFIFKTPSFIIIAPSETRPLLAALIMISPEFILIIDFSFPLIPFLQLEPFAFNVPVPSIIKFPSPFILIAAPSKFSSVDSLFIFSKSVIVEVPSNWIVTDVDFFNVMGAVVEQERVKESKIRITSVVDFLTSILHSEQEPVSLYVPD